VYLIWHHTVVDGNECFYGKCLYCKSPADGVCAEGSSLEGALVLWLPSNKFEKWPHPWRRTYRDDKQMRYRIYIKQEWYDSNNIVLLLDK
jgi:hypothetical protein